MPEQFSYLKALEKCLFTEELIIHSLFHGNLTMYLLKKFLNVYKDDLYCVSFPSARFYASNVFKKNQHKIGDLVYIRETQTMPRTIKEFLRGTFVVAQTPKETKKYKLYKVRALEADPEMVWVDIEAHEENLANLTNM